MLLGEQQDSSYIRLVMVKGVQLRRGHVERTVLGEAVIQSLVQRQQVHVMHGQVVRVVPALQVAHVDQRCSVESGRTKTRRWKDRKWLPLEAELPGRKQPHL